MSNAWSKTDTKPDHPATNHCKQRTYNLTFFSEILNNAIATIGTAYRAGTHPVGACVLCVRRMGRGNTPHPTGVGTFPTTERGLRWPVVLAAMPYWLRYRAGCDARYVGVSGINQPGGINVREPRQVRSLIASPTQFADSMASVRPTVGSVHGRFHSLQSLTTLSPTAIAGSTAETPANRNFQIKTNVPQDLPIRLS